MSCRTLLGLTALMGLALIGCFQAPLDPAGDCRRAGTCECATKADCAEGLECIDGRCEVLPDAGPGEGELGAACTRNAECNSGRCLPPGPGRLGVCTVPCDADNACPGTWECKPAGGEKLCTPPFNALCLPCETDRDCNSVGDRCLDIGGSKACGRDCTFTGCPTGYRCEDEAKQCVPTAGSCECTDVTVGLGRGCRNANATGTCYGFELCQADGTWAGCNALTPSQEVCNGVDDDCDGLLDTDDPGIDVSMLPKSPAYPACRNGSAGACVGTWTCAQLDGGFGWSCGAVEPRAEECNGLDEDCNGVADEPFLTDGGKYGTLHHCGACGYDCEVAVENLASGAGAVACELRSGAPTCVPKQCAPGHAPYPVDAPVMCLKAVSPACRTCSNDLDCSPFGDRCIRMGQDPGTWCAQRCDVDAPYAGCPSGYSCEQVGVERLCLPQGDSCMCSPARAGATRSCLVTLSSNTCVGRQTCGATGEWDLCDTSMTTVEVCDNTDNNCDGQVDEPYKNTRGSGTYDTDTQCGNCQTNCKAQWNAAIQHAIGGCNAGPGTSPRCEIVACTQQAIPGGGACQLDVDCGAGRTCHPLYQQCVRACATSADCAGGTCSNGFCTAACTTDAQCQQTFGKPSACISGLCQVNYQFVNADKEPTNGCECPAAAGGVDVPDLYPRYPQAGVPYVDRDCDLVDGVAATSLFVRAGASGGNGSRTAPFGTIGQAINAFNPATHSAILVAAGSYVEQVTLKNGVKLFGGYSTDFARRDIVIYPTLIESPEPDFSNPQHRRGTVNAEGINAETVIAGFTVRGYDVTFRPSPGNPGRNSYAVYVKDSTSALRIANNHIVGGRGGDAAQGVAGAAGANGGTGSDGRDSKECNTTTCTNESQPGGAAGGNPACTAANGTPGAASSGNLSSQGYQPPLGRNGQGGSNGQYFQTGSQDRTLCKYDCSIGGGNMNGGAAQNGADGSALAGGQGCQNAGGAIVGDEWVALQGSSGNSGAAGTGGGGGGAGGVVVNNNPATCTVGRRVGDLGGTGGGGGAGGCGGGAGAGGGSGGGSFAVFVVFSASPPSRPVIEGNIIEPGAGGKGGNGGPGGYGGAGGIGGEGGSAVLPAWCAGSGGHGGRGGNGGAGSGGGGGCGGASFGIGGNFLGPTNYSSVNEVASPAPTAAGSPGAGGASPAGSNSSGRPGLAGSIGAFRSF